MDAAESDQAFTDAQGGDQAARRRRRFVPRADFVANSHNAGHINADAFRADQDAALDHGARDPYEG